MTKGRIMRKSNRIIQNALLASGIVSFALFQSCVPQSRYAAPTLDIPEHFRGQDTLQMAQDSVNISAMNWKDFFQDEQLIELIDQGLTHNFDMQDALRNLEIAHLQSRQAKLNWLPTLDLELGKVNYQYRSKNYYGSPSSGYYDGKGKEPPTNMYVNSAQYTSGLSLSWELDIWGKIKSQSTAALAEYLKTHEVRNAVQTEIIAQIAEGYYNLLLLDAQMEVALTNYELTKNTLKIVELQRDAGQITSLAIQQTRNQMLVAKALIPSLKKQIAVQENALSLLTGRLPQDIVRDVNLSDVRVHRIVETGVPLQMLSQRPDVKQAELSLKAQNALVGVAQASRYPSLNIDIAGGLNSKLGENWFNIPGSLFGSLMGDLTGPIFNSKRRKTAFEVAKVEREKSEIDLQRTVYTAITEVTDALISLKTVDEQLEIAEEQVTTSRLGVKQSNLLFNSGYATYIEVINAQRNMLDSELNLNSLKQSKLISNVKLYKALGGGWK